MLAQWKSDGLITRKCLDRNEDMYDFFVTYVVLLKDRTLFRILHFISKYVSSAGRAGFITCKCLDDRNEDMYHFLSHSYIVRRKDRTLLRMHVYFIKAY